MRVPSIRVAAIKEYEALKQAAVQNNDVEAFAAAVAEIKKLDAQPDMYSCLCCNEDFPEGPHVELLVASILVFGKAGVVDSRDYGILATERRETGRRIKICGDCASWADRLFEYVERR